MSIREIVGQLLELYRVDLCLGPLSAVTDEMVDGIAARQAPASGDGRSAGAFGGLLVTIRDDLLVHNKAAHVALGVR